VHRTLGTVNSFAAGSISQQQGNNGRAEGLLLLLEKLHSLLGQKKLGITCLVV